MTPLLPPPRAGAHPETSAPAPTHSLGPVADDWAAIEVWLDTVADNSRSGTNETIKTYRYHLAKLRWYCERVLLRTPSTWDAQDVKAFKQFLAALPPLAISAPGAKAGEDGYTPFQKQPGASSQADILRFVQALFKALHGTGYIRLNPMVLMKTSKPRRLDKSRAVDLDLFDLVLTTMDQQPTPTPLARQRRLRDRFIFVCLRETGLRASELVGARMPAIRQLSDPKTRRTYWVFKVAEQTSKGGVERTIPVTPVLLESFIAYRTAFGLPPLPPIDEQRGLILSIRTTPYGDITSRSPINKTSDRRFFGAWRSVDTRFGLHGIVKERVRDAVAVLVAKGDAAEAARLERVSSHWLRHTFALSSLLWGQDIRMVSAALGHASVNTTMVYTEQDALDLIRSWEAETPGSVAQLATSGVITF